MNTLKEDIKTLSKKAEQMKASAEELDELSKKIYEEFFGPEKPSETETSMM